MLENLWNGDVLGGSRMWYIKDVEILNSEIINFSPKKIYEENHLHACLYYKIELINRIIIQSQCCIAKGDRN